MNSGHEEGKLLHLHVLDRTLLGPLACPVLLELVEIPAEGQLACLYRIRVYRADSERVPADDAWSFATHEARHVPYVRRRIRVRWREATGGGELPVDVFEEVGV